MDIDRLTAHFRSQLLKWQASQEAQTDAIVYERSFIELMDGISKEVLIESVEEKGLSSRKKKVQTRYGTVLIPNDHVLASRDPHFRLSAYMQDLVCWVGQLGVFDAAPELFERFYHCSVSDKQTERVSKHYGQLLEEQEAEALSSGMPYEHPEPEALEELHYAMLDGAQFLFREEKWKEAKLGRIFAAGSCLALSEKRHWIRQSTYCAHFGSAEAFWQKFERRLHEFSKLVFIADGAPWIWERVSQDFPDQIQILDFFHASEHLAQFAGLYFKEEAPRKAWIEMHLKHLRSDQLDLVLEELASLPCQTQALARQKRQLENYYWNNYHRMQYQHFEEQGFMIGSGPIEAAHRHVMQQRLKLSGQRWSPDGFQAIANLRVADKSGRWDSVSRMTMKNNHFKKAA